MTSHLLYRLAKSLYPARISQFLYESDCANFQSIPVGHPELTMRRYSINEPSGDPVIDRKLAVNRVCFQLCLNEEKVHESWLRRDVWLPRRFGFPIEHPVIGDSKTPEVHRGKGYFSIALQNICHQCHLESVARVYILVSPSNVASIRGIEKARFTRIAHLTAVRFGGLLFNKTKVEVR